MLVLKSDSGALPFKPRQIEALLAWVPVSHEFPAWSVLGVCRL
jgi:hypothetical protein